MGKYWKFFWPLALTGLATLLARQFQNGALGRYPDAVKELATYAYASSIFGLFQAALIFVPQMVNVFARSCRGKRISLNFTVRMCLLLSLPLGIIAFTGPGAELVAAIFGIRDVSVLLSVMLYLKLLLPLVTINGLRHFYTGLLIQSRRTGTVTLLNILFMVTVLILLVLGYHRMWSAAITLASAQIVASMLHLVLCFTICRRVYEFPAEREHAELTYADTFSFFWPVAVTSTLFALSRPIIYSFVARLPEGVMIVAALRVAFDFGMIFHNPMNQFRHLFITFGMENLAGVRRFLLRVMLFDTLVMLLVVVSPLSLFVLQDLLGIRGEVVTTAREVLLVMCLIPAAISWRNYYHGLALLGGTTRRMAVGSFVRMASIFCASWLCSHMGILNHLTATLILVLGFVSEALVVMYAQLSAKHSLDKNE